jgi:thermostable 8-oxoguanine DNA glycosylase
MSNVQTIIEGTKAAIEVAAVGGILAILKITLDGVMDVGVEFLKAKKDKLVHQLGADKYNQKRQLAVDIYNRVEQEFKGQIGVAEDKLKTFDKYLAEKIHGISQEDIQHFRESITGDANSKLLESGIIKPADVQKSAALQQAQAQTTQLTQENTALKQKLASIQSTAAVQQGQ